MAIKSMTGFGVGSARAKGVDVEVELRSVNRKQLEVVLRLPHQLAAFEVALQKQVKGSLARGRVAGTVTIELDGGQVAASVDHARAQAVVEALRRSAQALNLKDDLRAGMLLDVPNLLSIQTVERPAEELLPCVEKALQSALKKLVAMRTLEGKALAEDLMQRLGDLEGMLQKIKTLAPAVVVARREKMVQRLRELGFEALSSDERILKEIALFGEKCDITEETTRLASHLKQFRARLRSAKPVGRELDFLVQEFLREINTIGSKANDLAITQLVVAFKTELERIREQVQNVE